MGKKEYCALKIDMQKTYDRVERTFIQLLMEKMGFVSKCIGWVMQCVSSVSYRLCINGKNSDIIFLERGIRQGDPLSPYLFILVADVLSRMVGDVVERGEIKPLKITRYCPALSHLFFADDSLFFMEASVENVGKIKRIIEDYCLATGQAVNC